MADYKFKIYTRQDLGTPAAHNLHSVTLQYQEAEYTTLESTDSTWTYTKIRQSHVYVPENEILIALDANGTALKAYAELNKNSFFPPDLLNKPWLTAYIYWSAFEIEFHTARYLPINQRRFPSPKPPDRWVLTFNFTNGYRVRPSYEDLITGYSRDPRSIPDKLKIVSKVAQEIKIQYYRNNPYEQIPNLEYVDADAKFIEPTRDGIDLSKSRLKSIDWITQTVSIKAGKPLIVDIKGIVLGTLYIAEVTTISSYTDDTSKSLYGAKYLLNNIAALDELFDRWAVLYNDSLLLQIYGQTYLDKCKLIDKKLRFAYTGFGFNSGIVSLAITEGYNNKWRNYQLPNYQNYLVNPNVIQQFKVTILRYHPFFKSLPLADVPEFATFPDPNFRRFDKSRENYYPFDHANLIKWQLKPQIDRENNPRGIGAIAMDSPRIIEIHKALEAAKYSKNELTSDKPRITNLGYLIENLARVNGLRFDANGDIDLAKEKELYQPRTINNPTLGSPSSNGKYNKYGMSCFGTIGMIVPHLPTTYGKNGKQQQLFDVVHDNQQLAIAILRQQDVSLSIQHGSEIRINGLDGKVHAYPNQLAVMLECLQRLEQVKYTTERNLLISAVTGTEVRELFSGIGIPVTQKFLPLKDPANSRKSFNLPYFGHQKNKPSTAQLLTTVHVNLAIINGVLMPKKQPEKNKILNPFQHFTAQKSLRK